jgi:sigma-E factor negative regulatory protein RseB
MLKVLVAALLAGVAGNASAVDPESLLDAMSRNARSMDYQGVLTYERGQQLSSLRLIHAVIDGVEQERVVHLDGEHQEFLRQGHPVDCLHAGDHLLRLGPDSLQAIVGVSEQKGAAIANHYAIEFDGQERVAGRLGHRIRISPRDPYRYGMTLVLDEATSLLLKSETLDEAGRVLERFQFASVDIGGTIDHTDLQAGTKNVRVASAHARQPAALAEPFDWALAWIPEGFGLTGRELRQDPELGRPVQVQMYSDGLAVFAVFVEHGESERVDMAHAAQGATVAYVTQRGEGNMVTVVGEIPIATARLIANAVNIGDAGP